MKHNMVSGVKWVFRDLFIRREVVASWSLVRNIWDFLGFFGVDKNLTKKDWHIVAVQQEVPEQHFIWALDCWDHDSWTSSGRKELLWLL